LSGCFAFSCFVRRWGGLLAGVVAVVGSSAAPVEIWVAPQGQVDAAGTRDAPLASVAAAVRQVRELRRTGDAAVAADGARIILRGGRHEVSETIVLRPEDSGTAAAPTVIAAAPGEQPVLSGGRRVIGWR